jgi:hypothetical protein
MGFYAVADDDGGARGPLGPPGTHKDFDAAGADQLFFVHVVFPAFAGPSSMRNGKLAELQETEFQSGV